ncbi:hypothetical protein TUMEXPCC7403_11960 [Tumidithrix helvetica PCC 7403]|uniref:hypothetical protein n=1 Tax=Tumidithrix helvetica TaxID=3457545 RepID=UPI003C8DA98F
MPILAKMFSSDLIGLTGLTRENEEIAIASRQDKGLIYAHEKIDPLNPTRFRTDFDRG